MAMVLTALLRGELHRVGKGGVLQHGCILQALYMPDLQSLYKDNVIAGE
jgi:hypothetical protein